MKRVALAALLALTACAPSPKAPLPAPPSDARPPVDAGGAVAVAAPTGAAKAIPDAPPAPDASSAELPAPPDVAAPPADAVKTASGLATRVLRPGSGQEHPTAEDRVKVHYSGWTKSGRMFDSSVIRAEPLELGVNQVIPGWTEGLQLMVVGEKRRLWIPAELAYGQHPRGGAPAGALTFDVELLELTRAPKTPADVKAPPVSAKRTISGLRYRVLKSGPGQGASPSAATTVTVHYTGWTTDGRMFDSSVLRGEPFTFKLDQVIKGWSEGVQLMKVGDAYRFWIPASLAYGVNPSSPGVPAGMLVFDVELLGIHE